MQMTPLFYIDTISKSQHYKTPPESFWNLIRETVEELSQRFPEWSRLISIEALNKIIVAYCIIPPNEFNERFTHSKKIALRFPRDPSTLWGTISIGVLTPELEEAYLKSLPSPYRDTHQINPTTAPALQKITPQLIPKTKPSARHPREETIIQFITNHAPSINYLQGFIFISRHTKNRLSRRGRKVYPYGQDYVARKIEISLWTVNKIFSWLRSHHIIFKRTNENYDRKKCATWFVCTSWNQSTYFLDPEGRRPKKGSPRSRKK